MLVALVGAETVKGVIAVAEEVVVVIDLSVAAGCSP